MTGGASVVTAGGRRAGRHDDGEHALELPPGSSGLSPPICVPVRRLAVRIEARSSGTGLKRPVRVALVRKRIPQPGSASSLPRLPRSQRTLDVTRRPYRADPRGRHEASRAINAAIRDAARRPGTVVRLPAGRYRIDAPIRLLNAVVVRGADATRTVLISATKRTKPGVVVAYSADRVRDVRVERLTIDGNFAESGAAANGVQLADAKRVLLRRMTIRNAGRNGVLAISQRRTSTDIVIRRVRVEGSGQADPRGETGFGVLFSNVARPSVERSTLLENRGMGIGLARNGTGSADGAIIGNRIRQAPSTIGFEAIGLAAGSNRAMIEGNEILDSQDNGISASGDNTVVSANAVVGTYNHGIASAGSDNLIVQNFIRNVGRMDAGSSTPAFGGITLSGRRVTVLENEISDDQGTHTMAYGIKQNNRRGGHKILRNLISNWRLSEFFFTPEQRASLSADTSIEPPPAPIPRAAPARLSAWSLSVPMTVAARARGTTAWVRLLLENAGTVPRQVDMPRLRLRR